MKQKWIAGYRQAEKEAGIKRPRIKGSTQSTAQWLLKGHKRRRERDQKNPK